MPPRLCLAAAAVALISFPWGASADEPARHAVIIGVNDYADPGIPDLKYAESDARAVYETLTDPAIGRFPRDHVKLLLGADATPSAIKEALYGLRGVDKSDLVVVFYSGHGAKEGDEAYWVTHNASARALPATALSNTDIRKFLDMIPSERLVILLDCCYAASTVKKDLADPARLFGEFAGKGRVTIAGAAENQQALEYADKKAGIFTYFLVAGLRGRADGNSDGAVTFDELWSFLGDNVRKASVQQGGLHEPKIITEAGVTPQFLLTFNPEVQVANQLGVTLLRVLFDHGEITGAEYDEGRRALSEPAITPEEIARREVFDDLVAGRLAPKYLRDVLDRRLAELRPVMEITPVDEGKPTLAVVPFDVLGNISARDAGAILAEQLLPHFAHGYRLVDQTQLRHFLDQDDLTAAGLAAMAHHRGTKSLEKAVRLRAVRYLVVGTVSGLPDGSISVTARLCDWQTGGVEAGRVAQIGGADWAELVRRIPLLAARLGGSLIADPPALNLPSAADLGGIDALVSGTRELASITGSIQEALGTLTPQHPRILELTKRHQDRAVLLRRAIEEKVAELRFADAKLTPWYQPGHPERRAIGVKLEALSELLNGAYWLPRGGLILDLGEGVSMELVQVPAGEFAMGSAQSAKEVARASGVQEDSYSDEHPQHRVLIRRPFFMGTTEVTQAQWQAVMGDNPSAFRGSGRLPVENVSWDDCEEFCRRLSARTGRPIRLPTEAEWEYACRAGTKTPFYFGATVSTDQANYNGTYAYGSGHYGKNRERTVSVGSFAPNDWGLFDMHGNVWEWCQDWYGPYATNGSPQGPPAGVYRVLRGGSWYNGPRYARSAFRARNAPSASRNYYGLRVVSAP